MINIYSTKYYIYNLNPVENSFYLAHINSHQIHAQKPTRQCSHYFKISGLLDAHLRIVHKPVHLALILRPVLPHIQVIVLQYNPRLPVKTKAHPKHKVPVHIIPQHLVQPFSQGHHGDLRQHAEKRIPAIRAKGYRHSQLVKQRANHKRRYHTHQLHTR